MNNNKHLNDKQLFEAVFGTPPRKVGAHLNHCAECRGQADNLKNQLETLGALSREQAPTFSGAIELPEKRSMLHSHSRWSQGLKMTAAFSVMACLILVVLFTQPNPPGDRFTDSSNHPVFVLEFPDSRRVEQQIRFLSRNALPRSYLGICMDDLGGEFEDDVNTDSEFLDFLFPDEIDTVS